jgi:hypothetical protein
LIITLGLCLMLQPTPAALLASAVFGLLVGLMKLGARTGPQLYVGDTLLLGARSLHTRWRHVP